MNLTWQIILFVALPCFVLGLLFGFVWGRNRTYNAFMGKGKR